MYIAQLSLSRELYASITMCYANLAPTVSTSQLCTWIQPTLSATGTFGFHLVPLYVNDSSSIALYGLILFYGLTKKELARYRPLAKFLSIKLIVIFTFYQSFMVCRTPLHRPSPTESHVLVKFNVLKNRVIHGTEFWTSTNVADGLNALTICIEVRSSYRFFTDLTGWPNTDDFFLTLHDVGFPLGRVSGATGTRPHKHLATALGLDQLMYAFLTLSPSDPRMLTYLDPQGTLPSKLVLSLPISQVASLAGAHPPLPNRTLVRPSALRVTSQRPANHVPFTRGNARALMTGFGLRCT
jgi:Organic solute transporter Ostalpha